MRKHIEPVLDPEKPSGPEPAALARDQVTFVHAQRRGPGNRTKSELRPFAADEWRQCLRERWAATAELRVCR